MVKEIEKYFIFGWSSWRNEKMIKIFTFYEFFKLEYFFKYIFKLLHRMK